MGAREVVEREYLTRQALGIRQDYYVYTKQAQILATAAKIDGLLAAKVADIMSSLSDGELVLFRLESLADAIEHGRFGEPKPEAVECKT